MLKLIDKNILFTKNNPEDKRLGDLIRISDTATKPGFAIIGYPDDEGIQLNGGRLGAAEAPDKVRYQLSRMTPGFHKELLPITDLGNLDSQSFELDQRHEFSKDRIQSLMNDGVRTITIGGGHDYAYPDVAAFLNQNHKTKPLVINFDAHLDVRDTSKGLSSGTPFYRILNEFKEFDFVEIGIQQLCNTKKHLEFCKDKNTKVIEWDEYSLSSQTFVDYTLEQLNSALDRSRPCFLSVDIDVFSTSFAPGCSQAWPHGLTPKEFFPLYNLLIKRTDVYGLGVYEVSPRLDIDDHTSKLAAQIIYQYIVAYGI